MTWVETTAWLRARYPVVAEGASFCEVGRSPRVRVQLIDRLGRAWLHVLSEIQPALTARDALRMGGGLALGALVQVGDRLYVRHQLALEDASGRMLEECIAYIGDTARPAEGRGSPSPSATVFDHFEE